MSPVLASALQVLFLIALLAAVYVPFGTYMARVYTSKKHLRVERGLYRLIGVDEAHPVIAHRLEMRAARDRDDVISVLEQASGNHSTHRART